ncbi:MAG: YdbH domain-containing protein, partial [Desulforhopalus sp.]|nr:YdbH domain-containing protein [Desulforhopalus sp.]
LADPAFTAAGEITPEGFAVPATVAVSGTLSNTGTALHFSLAHDGFAHGDILRFSGISGEGDLYGTATGIDGHIDLQLKAIDTAVAGLTDLSVHLPVRYPLPAPGDAQTGHYAIAEIRHQGEHLGTLTGEIQPSREGVALKALLTSPIQPEMALSCQGPVSLQGEVTLDCTLPETPLRSADLATFFQLPAELTLDGTLAADARLTLHRGIPAADLRISLALEELVYRNNRLSGVDCALTLPRLPLLESAPSQLCTVGAADIGDLRFTNGRIRYRLEDPLALFIETARMNWCQGSVETGGVRLTPGTTDADLTLYCDRLNFAELLEQFGIAGTEGEGSLNGRLPLLISDRRLQLADGFLFSTPGNGGIVRFKNTEQLRAGMPDIGESTSLQYTMQALENFWYNWAKLSFNSHGDELLVALQLDGKPAAPLAFRLKNGQIAPDGKGAGLQHPIRLDVNFRLPLQEMFDYGRSIHSLLENR